MGRQQRIASFGTAAALIIAGAVCAAAIGGETGQILALVLIGMGFVLATSLVFLEVGLSEDKERARSAAPMPSDGSRLAKRTRRTGLGRSRSHRRSIG